MATANLSTIDDDILICAICLNTLEEPKILPCLHRYCKKCLTQVVNNISASGKTFDCPTCRRHIDVPDDGAKGFKGDFLLEAILESRKFEVAVKDKHKSQPCSSCDTVTQVVAICPDCGGFICDKCLLNHSVMKALRLHAHLVTLEDIETGKVSFNPRNLTSLTKAPKCISHKDMTLHISCQTCNKLICPVCAPIHHPGHKLEEISTAAERIKDKFQLSTDNLKENISKDEVVEIAKPFQDLEQEYSKLETVVKDYADNRKADIESKMDSALRRLKEKELKIKQKAESKLQFTERSKDFLMSEIDTRKKFSNYYIKKSTRWLTDIRGKVEHISKTSEILSQNVDNWSVLLAAPEFDSAYAAVLNGLGSMKKEFQIWLTYDAENDSESDLSSESDVNIDCEDIQSSDDNGSENDTHSTSSYYVDDKRRETEPYISVFSSPFVNKEWNWKQFDAVYTGTFTNLKGSSVEQLLALASISEEDGTATVTIIDTATKRHETIHHCYPLSSEDGIRDKVLILKLNIDIKKMVLVIVSKTSNLLITDADGNIQLSPFKLSVFQPIVTCIMQEIPEGELIVGNFGTTTLHRCNLQGEEISTIPIGVDDIKHPVSLSPHKEGNLLLCDGESKAVAINQHGELISQYCSRYEDDKPLQVCADQQGLVYVLWESKRVEDRISTYMDQYYSDIRNDDAPHHCDESHSDNSDQEEIANEDVVALDENDILNADAPQHCDESYSDTSDEEDLEDVTKVVMQYTKKGTFISEFIVDEYVTMMTTVTDKDGNDGIVVGDPDGDFSIFYMNKFGKKLSGFVLQMEATDGIEELENEEYTSKTDDKNMSVPN